MSWGKMSEADIATQLIGLIYNAALDPSDWRKFVDAIPKAIPGLNPVLYLADIQSTQMDLLLMSENWNGELVPEYMDYYDNLNPWTPGLATKAPVGTLVDGQQLISTIDLKKTEFYTDFLSRFKGFDRVSGTVIHRSKNSFGVFGIHSTEKMQEQSGDKINRLQKLITPHLIRACEISRKLGHSAVLARSLEYMLEAQSCAALVIDEHLHVYHANQVARTLFKTKILTLDQQARIGVGADLHESSALRRALSAALGQAPDSAENTILKISGKEQQLPLVAQIMPLTGSNVLGGMSRIGDKKQVLLIISDPANEPQNLQPLLAIAFGLTASEANLAAALTIGKSLFDYARGAEIQVATARSQLKAIFSKTNTHRQAELVALITRMTNPF